MSPLTADLTAEQIERFQQDGFLALDAITSDADVERLRDSYDRIFEAKAGRGEGNQFDLAGTDKDGAAQSLPQILNPAKYAPELHESELVDNVRVVAEQLLGGEVAVSFAHAIYKPPQTGAETPWHQDAAYWAADMEHSSLSFWVPLQPATLENGCMEFVPGSHRDKRVVEHRSLGGDPHVHALELASGSEAELIHDVTPCPLPPGGCTIHGPYTLHHTGPNRSDVPRRALILDAVRSELNRKLEGRDRLWPWMVEQKKARGEALA